MPKKKTARKKKPRATKAPKRSALTESLEKTYDEVPYGDEPFASTHPQRLGAIASLFGLEPAHPESARVLELGCARGNNLIAMAYELPGSRFIGIDLASRQVEQGTAFIAELGLKNIELRHLDLLDVGKELGEFDYIVSHGTLSWVPPDVANKMFGLCGELLSPNGIAYLSYNTYPGWKSREILRDMMLFESAGETKIAPRVHKARIALEIVSRSIADNNTPQAQYLKQELPDFQNKPDWYFVHDFIAEVNRPFYISEIFRAAEGAGLQYLADTELTTVTLQGISPGAQQIIRGFRDDIPRYEQYCDIARNRMFRRSLFCRKERSVLRRLDTSRLQKLYIASRFTLDPQPSAADPTLRRLAHPSGGAIETRDAILIEALTAISELWPAAVSFEELWQVLASKGVAPEHLKPLAEGILRGIFADLIDIRLSAGAAASELPLLPRASLLARVQSRESERVTSLNHQVVDVEDFDREVLALLTGENGDSTLLERLFPEEELNESHVARLAKSLERLLRSALIHSA